MIENNKTSLELKDLTEQELSWYINLLLENQGRRIEVINHLDNSKEDLMEDFVSIVTSFCARLYGKRRTKRKTEKIISELNQS